jgi:ribosomal protein S18 acetylase RimI-like enzyme
MINQMLLDEQVFYFKKVKYKGNIQDIKLEYCKDKEGDYIYLVQIKIKKSQKNKGYGSLVLSDLVEYSNKHNLRIKLWATDVFGADLKRLIEFYKRFGFVLLEENKMVYYPNK